MTDSAGTSTGFTALVTGAGSGLGMESALYLAARGYRVFGSVLNDAEASDLRTEASRRGVPIESCQMDVTNEEQVHRTVASVVEQAGKIDALVQFAGMGLRGFFEDLSLQEVRRVYDVNVFGMMAVTQAVLPYMRQRRSGRILMTTSAAGRMGSMTIAGYCSSKFAGEGLAECLWQEVYPLGIRVSLIEPGLIHTPHFTVNRNRAKRSLDPSGPYYKWFCEHEKIVDGIMARKGITAEDVAKTVYQALTAREPKLRYLVGRNSKIIMGLRRYIPGEIFQRIYWGIVRKMVTQPKNPTTTLSGAE